jgi:excisionase family DNA binding protein
VTSVVRIAPAPFAALGPIDCAWVAGMIDALDADEAIPPAIVDRARHVAACCHDVDTSGQLAPEPLLTVTEAATVLAVSPRTVRRMIARGNLPGRRIGRSVRVARADLERFSA